MENKMNKFGGERLLAVLVITFACVCMWGCSDDVTFKWEETRRNAKVIGFVDDSLVMVGDYRFWLESRETWNGGRYDDEDAGNPRLCVYNYRVQEDGPRWCDSVSELHSSSWFYGQLTDSVIWGSGLPNSIKLWKIGEKPHELKLNSEFEGCSKKIEARRIHEWVDGKFIVLGATSVNGKTVENAFFAPDYGDEYCQYAVLDTLKRIVTYKRLEKDLEWIKQCDDVRAWEKDVYCLLKNYDKTGFYLNVNEKKEDSIFVANVINISNLWNTFEFEFMGNMIYFGHNINMINYEKKKIKIYPNVKATSAYNFLDEKDNSVNYEEMMR